MSEHTFPKSWAVRAISEIAELGNGGTPPKANVRFWDGGKIPFVTAADLTATYVSSGRTCLTEAGLTSGKTAVCEPGDLLVGTRTRVGNCAIAKARMGASQDITRVHLTKECLPEFYRYYFTHAAARLAFYSQGTSILGITREILNDLPIPVPPLAEQRRLVACIETLTSRLDQARQARQAALAEAQTVFQRALEIAFSDDATEDWNEHDADELFEIVGGQVSPLDAEFSALPYLGPEHVESGTGRIIGERVSVAELKMKSGKYRFTSEHVVYSKIRPALRKVCTPDYPGLCSADMYALQANLTRISREFLKFLLLAPAFSDYSVEKSDRNAMPKINQTALRAFRFRIPVPSEQVRIASLLTALLDKHAELRRLQTETEAELAAFTPALLAKAFRGEL